MTGGQGALLIAANGIAGAMSGKVTLNVPGVSFSGTFGLAINNTTTAVSETFMLGDRVMALNLPAGPYIQISGQGVVLEMLGQRLSGDFSFEKSTSTKIVGNTSRSVIRVAVANLSLALGNGEVDYVRVSNGTGSLLITPEGLAGQLSATVAIQNISGVSFSGTFGVKINNTNVAVRESFSVGGTTVTMDLVAGPFLEVSGTNVALTILDVTVRADFTFQQITTLANKKVVRVAVANLGLSLQSDGTEILRLSGGSGSLLITPQGLAGQVSMPFNASISSFQFNTTFTVAFNTIALPVNESFDVANTTILMKLPAGPFVRVTADNTVARLTAGGSVYELTGDFYFDQVTRKGTTAKLTRLVMSDVSLTVDGKGIKEGSAALIFTGTGIAGVIGGKIALSVPGFSLGATVGSRLIPRE